eukprot:XP_011674094.1 PREDICTED: monocarboxylate transporter 12-like [Strongylocentrotus purpuratus]
MLALNDFFQEKFVLMNTIAAYGYTVGSMLLPVIMERSFEAYGYAGAFIILGGIALNLVVCGATIRKAPSNATTNEGEMHEEENEQQECHSEGESSKQNESFYDDDEEDDSEKCVLEQRRLIQTERRSLSHQETSPNERSSWPRSAFQTCKGSCGMLNEPLYLFTIPNNFLVYYTLYAWMLFLVPHAEHLGIPSSKAIFLSTIGGICGIIGRTIFIILCGKRINIYVFYITIGVICTISFLLDFTSSTYEVRATLAFVQGFSFFIEDSITSSLCKDTVFDDRNFDTAFALSAFSAGLGATCAGTFTVIPPEVFIIVGLHPRRPWSFILFIV